MKKVLALGYIPKWKGGRQLTGLATGLFDLHDAVNGLHDNVEVTIAATDIFTKSTKIDNTPIIGWSKSALIIHAIRYFYRLPKFLKGVFTLRKYKPVTNSLEIFAKLIFLDYAIQQVKPDFVHLHGALYALYRPYIWRSNLKVVLRLHGLNGYDETILGYQQYRKIEKDILSIPYQFVTFVTESICDEWKDRYGLFLCPMIPLINGYNAAVFYPPKEKILKKYDLITISGLSERKGQDRVLEAIKLLKDEGHHISYLIIGSGNKNYEETLISYVNKYSLDVTFISYTSQDKLNSMLWESKYFILPSVTEGFGKVYIESIGAGIPVILPQTLPIAHEKNILSPQNSILIKDYSTESIYNGIKAMHDMYISDDISATVNHLKWSQIARQYIELYKK